MVVSVLGIFIYRQKHLTYEDPSLNIGYITYEPNPDEDTDGDGLINSQEMKYRTDLDYADADWDGLSDYYEIMESKTHPLNPDSDFDGLADNVELMAGLDPNNDKSIDMTPDNMQIFEVTRSYERINLLVSGNANIFDVYVDTFNTTGLKNTPGLVIEVYEFHLDTPFHKAEVIFSYTDNEINSLGIDENDLSIFCFTNVCEFEKVNSIVDTVNNTVTAKLQHFSRYVLGDGTIINTDIGSKVMLLIDNSGSMYPKALCEASNENDLEFRRLNMANALIDYADDNIQFGVAKFTATYTLLSKIGTDAQLSKEKINEIRTLNETFDGTFIASSIKSALSEFKANDHQNRKYIVILTDGETTENGLSYNEEDAIRDCIKKHVTVIVIGLGNYTDVDYLQKIAYGTGGIYLHASNADALESIYEKILNQMQFATVEIEHGGETKKAIFIADSGFNSGDNGYAFVNYNVLYDGHISTGQCYGLAAFAQKFYRGSVTTIGEPYEAKMGGALSSDRYNTSTPAYDLSDNEILKVTSLHDYSNKWLDIYNKLIYITPATDKYYRDGKTLKFKDEFKERINNSGCKYLTTIILKGEGKWEGGKYTSYENLVMDIDSYLDSGEDDPYMNFIVATYWHYCLQARNLSNNKRTSVDVELGKNLDDMIAYVSQRIPVVLTSEGHSINVTRILRDAENPKLYYIEVYDNNTEYSRYYYTAKLKKVGIIDSISISKKLTDFNCKFYDLNGNKVSVKFDVLY